MRAKAWAQSGKEQGASHQAEESQGCQQMDREVGQPVSARVELARGVVEREGQVDERASSDRRLRRRRERNAQRRQLADLLVVEDRSLVVEDERCGKTVGVDDDARDDDDGGTDGDAAREGQMPAPCNMRSVYS